MAHRPWAECQGVSGPRMAASLGSRWEEGSRRAGDRAGGQGQLHAGPTASKGRRACKRYCGGAHCPLCGLSHAAVSGREEEAARQRPATSDPHVQRTAQCAPSPEPCSPAQSPLRLTALAARPAQGPAPLASASPKEAGAGPPQAGPARLCRDLPFTRCSESLGMGRCIACGGVETPGASLPWAGRAHGERLTCSCSSLGPRLHHLCSQPE